LTYALEPGAPAGAVINAASGAFSWTPAEAQGSTTNTITVKVTDNGVPAASDSRTFTVVVNELNTAPTIEAILDRQVDPVTLVDLVVAADDVDEPENQLTFNLEPGAPPGAVINPTTGVLTWTPTLAQANTTNVITIRVTDDGIPSRSATRSFTVIVRAALSAPAVSDLAMAGDGSVTLEWAAQPGRKYRIECIDDIAETSWKLVGEITATSNEASIRDGNAQGVLQRFYRIGVVR
jgi:hypothetical protein